MAHLKPRSLYIHLPWCIRKCPYCDFNSHPSPQVLPEERYIKALITDLYNDLEIFPGSHLTSIFIGGGTPSLISAEAYEILFQGIHALIPFDPAIEITLEANPGASEAKRFREYRELGINRLSIGVQSFQDASLKRLGRIHGAEDAIRAIKSARSAGFEVINIDLMHGLPEQDKEDALNDLKTALDHEPEHLSWYQLTIEKNTLFYKKPPTLPNEDELAAIEDQGFSLLANHGYDRYEISAFSRQAYRSQHNLNYWLFGDYYGIGAGAHGKLTQSDFSVYRTEKPKLPKTYLADEGPSKRIIKKLNDEDLIFEFMLNTLRLQDEISFQFFTEQTGLDAAVIKQPLIEAAAKGLVTLNGHTWQITPLGRRFTNDVQAMFLS